VKRDIQLVDANASTSTQQRKVERLTCGSSGPSRTVKLKKEEEECITMSVVVSLLNIMMLKELY
jgi:hypothetical protein